MVYTWVNLHALKVISPVTPMVDLQCVTSESGLLHNVLLALHVMLTITMMQLLLAAIILIPRITLKREVKADFSVFLKDMFTINTKWN